MLRSIKTSSTRGNLYWLNMKRFQIILAIVVLSLTGLVFPLLHPKQAAAAITFRSVSTDNTGSGGFYLQIPQPTGAVDGDTLILAVTTRYSSPISTGGNVPSDWTELDCKVNAGANFQQCIYWRKYKDSDPANYQVYCADGGTSVKAVGIIADYAGVDTVSAVDTSTGQLNTSSTTVSTPQITTANANELIVGVFGTATAATFSSSLTSRGTVSSSGGGSAGTKASTFIADTLEAVSGVHGPYSATASAAAVNAGQLVALKTEAPASVSQYDYRWFSNVNSPGTFSFVRSDLTSVSSGYTTSRFDLTNGYVYTLGYDQNVHTGWWNWRIEKRSLSDYSLVTGFGTNGIVEAAGTLSGSPSSQPRDMEIDVTNGYMYISGYEINLSVSTSQRVKIEKRLLSTGALVTGFGTSGRLLYDPSTTGNDETFNSMEIDPSGGYLYTYGWDDRSGTTSNYVEKRLLSTGALVSGFGSGGILSDANTGPLFISPDRTGLYMAVDGGIRLISATNGSDITSFGSGGTMLFPLSSNYGANFIFNASSNVFYLRGETTWASTDFIEERDMTTGAYVTSFGSSGRLLLNTSPSPNIYSLDIDTTNGYLYLSGSNYVGSDEQWRFEKRSLSNGALVTSWDAGGISTDNPTKSTNGGWERAYDVKVDPSNNLLHSAGSEVTTQNLDFFRFEKRSTIFSPFAAQNTPATAPNQGSPFRLRQLLHTATSSLYPGGRQFKLQYAQKSGTCDTSFSGESYSDVSPSSGAIRFYDNSSTSSDVMTTTDAADAVHGSEVTYAQAYAESNPFSPKVTTAVNQDGVYDMALVDFSSAGSTSYCFRMVNSDGSLLDSYSYVAEITTAPGGTGLPSPAAASQASSPSGTAIATGGVVGHENAVLQFSATAGSYNASDTLTLQVEVQPVGTAFTGTATYSSGGVPCNFGTCQAGTVISVTSGTLSPASYHWQVRVSGTGGVSSWVSYPTTSTNAETAADFSVITPSSLMRGGKSFAGETQQPYCLVGYCR